VRDVPLKHLCTLPAEYGLNIAPDRYRDEGVRLLRTSDIATSGGVRDSGGVFLDAVDVPPEMRLRDGDLLFSRSGTLGRALLYGRDQHGEATFAGFLVRFRLRRGIDPRAIRYWSESSPFVGTVASQAIQSTISNFNADRYANLAVPARLVEHSAAVADYLDMGTARIDALVKAKGRLVALLDQRRRTTIGAAMTGRISHTASAITGATPRPLRVFASVDLGKARTPEATGGPNMVPYLRAANVKNGHLELESINEMNFTPAEQRVFALRPGDVLVTEGAGSLLAVGANAVWSGDIEGTICFQNHLLRLRATDRAEPRFIAWWARYAYESGLLASLATGAQILNLGAENVRALPVRMPSRDAQRTVADLLDVQVGSLEAAKSSLLRQIDLLLERRQALITAAVTGHLRIPGVAA
jgi:type I restriction enzyme, S subunit